MIESLIHSLSLNDQKAFVSYLKQRNKRRDTRNVDLFRSFLAGKERSIQSEIGMNAYYVLKKRLSDNLLDFLANKSFESEASNEIQVIKDTLLARKLLLAGETKISFKLLLKAEKAAVELEHYSLLNEVYHIMIEFSEHKSDEFQQKLFEKLEKNTASFLEQERLNMVYAAVKKAYRSGRVDGADLQQIMEETVAKFNISSDLGYSFKSLYQLANILDIEASRKSNYGATKLFFESKYQEIVGTKADNERSLYYHIGLLYILANIYFRKRQFSESQQYLGLMNSQMKRFDKKLWNDFYPKYANLEALNVHFLGNAQKGQNLLLELNSQNFSEIELANVRLTLSMISFHKSDFKTAKNWLNQLNLSEKKYTENLGEEWALNKRYFEIILALEQQDFDFAEAKIASLIRKFNKSLQRPENAQILQFLKLIRMICREILMLESKDFIHKVETTIDWRPSEEEDIFRICFYGWLKAKMNADDVYKTTLKLLST